MPRPPSNRKAPAKRSARPRTAPRAVRGRGFYKGFGRDLGRYIGKGVGMLGSHLTGVSGLGDAAEKLGGWFGDKGSKMTGWGAYHVQRNSLVADIPQIRNPSKEGAVQIRHREYIGDVISSGKFQTQYVINLNAALASSFPWLSGIARQFQQHELNGMIFEYKPTSGNAISSTNSSLGEVVMSTNYDSVNPPFTNILQMLNTEFSQSIVPSCGAIHPIECAPNQSTVNILYTREGPVPTGADVRLYDLGFFQLATQGQQQAGVTLGQLWVNYDYLLYKPILVDDNTSYAHYLLEDIGVGAVYGTKLNTAGSLVPVVDTLSASVRVDSNNIYFTNDTSHPQAYMVTWQLGNGSVSTTFSGSLNPTLGANLSFLNIQDGNITAFTQTNSGASLGGVCTFVLTVVVAPNPSQVDLGTTARVNIAGFTAGVAGLGDLWIQALPQNAL